MFTDTWSLKNFSDFGNPDSVVSHLPLLGSPWQVLAVNVLYVVFVFKLGPAFMRNRPAYNLKMVLLIYNAIQVLLSFCIIYNAYLMILHYRVYDIRCLNPLPVNHPLKYIEDLSFYLYCLNKFIDYLDTIFFVLRKSMRQISFLHVYHHIMMANSGFIYFRYFGAGGHIGIMGVLNAVVHSFMYSYYFMSALKPSMKRSIWWKKYITRLQLVQFVLIILTNLYPLLFVPNCQSPKLMFYFAILQGSIMLVLFGNFYRKTYMKNEKIE